MLSLYYHLLLILDIQIRLQKLLIQHLLVHRLLILLRRQVPTK